MSESDLTTTSPFPLSPMQQGMLFHHLKEQHSGVDVEQLVVHLPEAIDASRLQEAWRWLVQRHDVLRSRFIWEGVDQALQEIQPSVAVPFAVEEATALDDRAQQVRLENFLRGDRTAGFDLSSAPLLRLRLFKWSDTSWSLVWTFHHAVLDGRTFQILLREVFEAYTELETGRIAARPAPPDYRRYIDWLQTRDFSHAEKYWKHALAGFSAPTPLVVDRPLAADEDVFQQGEAWERLDAPVTAQLRSFAAANGLTQNSIVMAAWSMLLHRYSGEEDIVFGATRACRKSSVPDADETVGLFINTVPIRMRLDGGTPAREVLKAARQQWLDVRPYEHTPLARVKAMSAIPPSQPLFETLVVFENYLLDTVMRSLGAEWANRKVELHELTNVPITLAAYDGDSLHFKIEFDRRRLDDETITRLLGHLRQLLEGIAANPDMPVARLPLVTPSERRALVDDFNRGASAAASSICPIDGGATLHGLFEVQAAKFPDHVALTCDGQSLTYRQLNSRANRIARALSALGVTPDTLVGLCLERTNDLVIALLAILKAGGAYLPIDLAYPADRVAFMLEDAKAPVLLTQRKLVGDLPSSRAHVLCVEDVLRGDPDEACPNLSTGARPDHAAYVIYTSGTTGKPKGSVITHRNVVRLFACTDHWYGFNERDVWTLFHSSAFDFSVWEIWGALLYGGRVVVVPFLVSRNPDAFYELLASEQVTVLNQTPSAFRQLIQAEEVVGQKALALRYVVFGGEALEMQSLRPWFDRHGDEQPRLVNMYGITETTVHVTYRALSKADVRGGSVIGVPIPDLQIYILDQHGQLVPIGVPGEMHVGGAGLAREYLRRPELTGQRFIPDTVTGRDGARLYRTGDLARFLPGRDIEYLGRIDHQVKIRGFRIELGEVESVLCQHPQVRAAVVMAREDVPGTKRLVAYVVSSAASLEISALREHLKVSLPEYMVPAAFVFLDALPLTNNGKVDRKALPVPEQQRSELTRYVAPRTDLERALAAIWSKVLNVAEVGIHDNFFELGGDSILSIQIIATARRANVKVTPKLLFAHQTIAELAASVEWVSSENGASAAEESVQGDVALTPIQHWFFEQNLEDPHHYNQAFLFDVTEPIARGALEQALTAVAAHHDGLRLRYTKTTSGWSQRYSTEPERALLKWVSLETVPATEQARAIEDICASAQAELNIETGPLLKAVYFDLGQQAGRVFLAVHHLAVDGVSWRPLVEDLEAAYLQSKSGRTVELPAKSTSFKKWAEHLAAYSRTEALRSEVAYWKSVTDSRHTDIASSSAKAGPQNTEGSSHTVKVSLSVEDTQALLQQVPAAYNTQINDVLLTALARAWNQWNGSRSLFTNLEGHGREHLFDDVDLSRTVGWFTSIFPVRVDLPGAAGEWRPGDALKAVKEQLRQVPRHGIGYGILRYLAANVDLAGCPEPSMVFNYLGQFDQVITGSSLFRFADESVGSWHSPRQRRRHELELNSLVRQGRFELWCTYSEQVHEGAAIRKLAANFVDVLKELIAHCAAPDSRGRTPSDYPLARLDQAAVDRLVGTSREVEDIYALSPIQTLFHSANPGTKSLAFDQWHCSLRGALDVPAFQRAWQETLRRHTILRSSIRQDGLPAPVQVVSRDVQMPWSIEDWTQAGTGDASTRWQLFLESDRKVPLDLTAAPLMRFALVRAGDREWRFLWSVPALLLDGWSWPLVFRDVSRLYEHFALGNPVQLDPARPYRDYVEWLGRQKAGDAPAFWSEQLAGFTEPTLLPTESVASNGGPGGYERLSVQLSAELTKSLQASARSLQTTLNTLVQGAWATLLRRTSGSADVVFGAAFAGRPTDLTGAESIVGPLVNSVPVRVTVDAASTLSDSLRALHARLLELSAHQFTPLMDIQRVSEMPWRHRLFDSMVVFQNYAVDDAVRRLGGQVEVEDFVGPIHTNYPLMLLAEPGAALRLTLIYDRKKFSVATVGRFAHDLALVMEKMGALLDRPVNQLLELLSVPVAVKASTRASMAAVSQNYAPPQTKMEEAIAHVWGRMFGLDRVGVEENFFDLGGHSLLMLQMHTHLKDALATEFPIVTLFEHPTIRSLARHFDTPAISSVDRGEQLRHRAQRQREALSQLRMKLRREDK